MTQIEHIAEEQVKDTPWVAIEKVVSLSKRRGFVYPNSEIYGGVGASMTLDPSASNCAITSNATWWWSVVQKHDNAAGIDGATITHPRVWEASGHVENFVDRLVDCTKCKRRFRIDHLEPENLAQHKCPACGGELTQNLASLTC